MSGEDKVTEIKGTITLKDGTTSEFNILAGYGWNQWGAVTERLGRTVYLMDDLERAAAEYLYDENDPDQNDELPLPAGNRYIYQSTQQDEGPYGYPERTGEIVEVVRQLDDTDRDPEVGDMYEVAFIEDGQKIHVFREELE